MAAIRRGRRRGPRADPRVVAAMVLGGILGLALLANLGPRRVPEPPRVEIPGPRPSQAPSPAAPASPPPAPAPVPSRREAAEAAEPAVDDEAEPLAFLDVQVVGADGAPVDDALMVVSGCPGYAERDGRTVARPGSCELVAARRDGLLQAFSAPVEVQLVAGQTTSVRLELPEARTGGVGIRFRPTPFGMRVLSILPDSPAWEAGLEPGDIVTEVDGVLVQDLDMGDFVSATTGPEGTDVELTVRYETEEGVTYETLVITRRYLES